jgi:hypothetical protein
VLIRLGSVLPIRPAVTLPNPSLAKNTLDGKSSLLDVKANDEYGYLPPLNSS